MKHKNMRGLFNFISIAAALLLAGCSYAERTTLTGTINRLATVKQTGNSVRLEIDYTGETFTLKNFSKASDLATFNVEDGDRVLAQISYNEIPSADIYTYELEKADTIALSQVDLGNCPRSDSVGIYIHFENLRIDNAFVYPSSWTNGHYLNTMVTYYPDSSLAYEKNRFFLNVKELRGDTLSLMLTADIPNSNYYYQGASRLLCYDLSKYAQAGNHRIDSILNLARSLETDSLTIELNTCDTLGILNRDYYEKRRGFRSFSRMKLDF